MLSKTIFLPLILEIWVKKSPLFRPCSVKWVEIEGAYLVQYTILKRYSAGLLQAQMAE